MKVKIENQKGSKKLIKIEVENERVQSVLDKVYTEIQKEAHVQGFRVGKVPRNIIEKQYSKAAADEAVSRLVEEAYRKALHENNIDPVGYPVIEDVDFAKEKPFTFTAKVDVRPDFKLKTYKGLKIKNQSAEVSEEDIDKALDNIQESLAQYQNIDARPIADGDHIVCLYETYTDTKLVDKRDEMWLYINDKLQPRQVYDALLGAVNDVTKEVEVTLPQDYQNKELAGKRVLYKITPKQIKHKVLPDINDELAKQAGSFESLQQLKDHIRVNMLQAKKQQIRRDQEAQICEGLLKNHTFDIPESVVERQEERLVEDAKLRLLYQGYKKEDVDKQQQMLKQAVAANAKNNVRIFFILDKIIEQENVTVDDKQLQDKIVQIAGETGQELQAFKKRIEETGTLDNLREQMLHDKVMDMLISEADSE